MGERLVYLLFDYEEYGPRWLAATDDPDALPQALAREWAGADWYEEALAVLLGLLRGEPLEPGRAYPLVLGWGGPVLRVERLRSFDDVDM